MKNTSIEQSLTDTLRKSDLSTVAINATELTLDSVLDAGLLKDIPVIRTLNSLWKTGANVRDYIFMKKLASFIQELQTVNVSVRNEMLNLLEEDLKYNQKVG